MNIKDILELLYGVQEYEIEDSFIDTVNERDAFDITEDGFTVLWNLPALEGTEFRDYLKVKGVQLIDLLSFVAHVILATDGLEAGLDTKYEEEISISLGCLIRYKFRV
eukprot:Blabericola_migrator_1__3548@NODE_2052_length_3356_cov_89_705990_g1302_i0_p6_GENE_NODE_2052_length_3356_cov_89_705990_g1302_i0NODE_2052_length_3356_cov_89_705990_g1302_i0_p6_ORF_typecomplete_len108_score32_90HUN/PF08729_10/0_96_NODE_2052_length_3356_cov_89_705990_g1302_i034357